MHLFNHRSEYVSDQSLCHIIDTLNFPSCATFFVLTAFLSSLICNWTGTWQHRICLLNDSHVNIKTWRKELKKSDYYGGQLKMTIFFKFIIILLLLLLLLLLFFEEQNTSERSMLGHYDISFSRKYSLTRLSFRRNKPEKQMGTC